tara:strand:+ start:43 stop:480 length:438 start_codon:yes stop_codon:yes gene_type:complete
MVNRVIRDERDRALLFKYIEGQGFPLTVEITKGAKRSLEQNKLQRKWMTEIAEQSEGHTPEDLRAFCKLTIGVPILRAENEIFREKYDRIVRPLSYEERIEVMAVPLDIPVTRIMTTKQKTAYLDAVYKFFTERGIVLTVPESER